MLGMKGLVAEGSGMFVGMLSVEVLGVSAILRRTSRIPHCLFLYRTLTYAHTSLTSFQFSYNGFDVV